MNYENKALKSPLTFLNTLPERHIKDFVCYKQVVLYDFSTKITNMFRSRCMEESYGASYNCNSAFFPLSPFIQQGIQGIR